MTKHRVQPLDPKELSPEQKDAYDAVAAGPRGGVRGPFVAFLQVPELAKRVASLGNLLRFEIHLPPDLAELAITVTAKSLRSNYEWHVHSQHAIRHGIPPEVIEGIRSGEEPAFQDPLHELVYAFVSELQETKRVSDRNFAAAEEAFGREVLVELVGLVSYFNMVATTLNAFGIDVPEGAVRAFDP